MLIQEAQWFARQIDEIGAPSLFPMLNVGSSTWDFRHRQQPWIDKYIFAPARHKKLTVYHADIKVGKGIDIVGDLTDNAFLERLIALQCRSVLCSNLLEHVTNREEIAIALVKSVPVGGYLLVSCPYRFPYHPDPIDTLFRPDVEELAGVFAGSRLVLGEILKCGSWVRFCFQEFIRDPLNVALKVGLQVLRPLIPLTKISAQHEPASCRQEESLIPWFFKRIEATCVVLQKY